MKVDLHDYVDRRWRAAHPEDAAEQDAYYLWAWERDEDHYQGELSRRRERIAAARRALTPKLRHQILVRDLHRCRGCGITSAEARIEVDHIVPVSKGGLSTPCNLRAYCFVCNRGKGCQ